MRSLSQYKKAVCAQTCVLPGLFVLWYVSCARFVESFDPAKGLWSSPWGVLFLILPLTNLVFGVILWVSYCKAGKVYPWLVSLALITAILPVALCLAASFVLILQETLIEHRVLTP